jgi:hypothetical protein
MERPGEPLLGTVDAESVRSFLGGRSALDTSEQTVAEWRRELAGRELWLVGPRRLVPDDHRPYVVVRELLAPGSSGVSVQVRMSSVPERSVHLPMPEDDLAARLLRNPFDVPTQLTPPLISNVLLTPSGSRTFFKTSANALVSFGTPSSPQAVRELADPVSRKRRAFLAKEGLTIVAAGVRGQRSAWLAIGSGVAVLEATEPLRRGAGRVLTCPLPSGPPPERLWPLVISTSPLAALYVGGDGSLWRLRFDGQRAELLAEGTETLVRTDLERAIASVRGYRGRPALIQISPGWVTELPQSYAGRGSFIHHSQRNGVETVIHASEHADGGWLLDRHARRAGHEERSHLELRPGADKRVVGVFDAQARLDSMGLCVLGGDARWLYLIETTRLALTLCTTSQPIVEVAVATSGTRIAYRTSQGVLGFVDGARRVRVPLEQTL